VPRGHMCQGSRREPLRHVRRHKRPGPSPVGLVCSRRLVPQRPCRGADIPRPCGEKPCQRARLHPAGPPVGPGRRGEAHTTGGWREGARRPTSRAGSGGACGLPGHSWDAPAQGAGTGCLPCVRARPGASEGKRPGARRFAWTSALAPVVCGAWRPWRAWAAPPPRLGLTGHPLRVEPPLGIGRDEGTETLRGRRARTASALPAAL
jgi:hypothetical protein